MPFRDQVPDKVVKLLLIAQRLGLRRGGQDFIRKKGGQLLVGILDCHPLTDILGGIPIDFTVKPAETFDVKKGFLIFIGQNKSGISIPEQNIIGHEP